MNKIILTTHAKVRMKERAITLSSIRKIIQRPLETTHQGNDIIKVIGQLDDTSTLVVIYKNDKNKIIIITTYPTV